MARGVWIFDPQSGGRRVPESAKAEIRRRILAHAEKHYYGKFNRIDVRFRGQFCYIDAYLEPCVPKKLDPKVHGETREERLARLRATPTHLCRLRYFGNDFWSMAFYSYSHEKYEPCLFDTDSWEGTPEEAFDTGSVYLRG